MIDIIAAVLAVGTGGAGFMYGLSAMFFNRAADIYIRSASPHEAADCKVQRNSELKNSIIFLLLTALLVGWILHA